MNFICVHGRCSKQSKVGFGSLHVHVQWFHNQLPNLPMAELIPPCLLLLGVAILIILSLLSSTPLVNSVIISNNMATTFLELGNHCM